MYANCAKTATMLWVNSVMPHHWYATMAVAYCVQGALARIMDFVMLVCRIRSLVWLIGIVSRGWISMMALLFRLSLPLLAIARSLALPGSSCPIPVGTNMSRVGRHRSLSGFHVSEYTRSSCYGKFTSTRLPTITLSHQTNLTAFISTTPWSKHHPTHHLAKAWSHSHANNEQALHQCAHQAHYDSASTKTRSFLKESSPQTKTWSHSHHPTRWLPFHNCYW
jgi:hypothetical protein